MAVDVLRAASRTPRNRYRKAFIFRRAAMLQGRRGGSVLFVHFVTRPGSRNRVLDWLPGGARFCVLAAICNTKSRSVRWIRYSREQPLNYQ
jgi:hypothetical protein